MDRRRIASTLALGLPTGFKASTRRCATVGKVGAVRAGAESTVEMLAELRDDAH